MRHERVQNYLVSRKRIFFGERDNEGTLTQFSFWRFIYAASMISLVIFSLYFAITCRESLFRERLGRSLCNHDSGDLSGH